jgi:hypothetical protein
MGLHFLGIRGWSAPALLGWVATQSVVAIGWLLFRAPDMTTAWAMLRALPRWETVAWAGTGLGYLLWFVVPMLVLDGIQRRRGSAEWGSRLSPWQRALLLGALIYAIALAWSREPASFLYFQF